MVVFQFFQRHVLVYKNTFWRIINDTGKIELLEGVEVHSLGENSELHGFQILWTFCDNHDVGSILSA